MAERYLKSFIEKQNDENSPYYIKPEHFPVEPVKGFTVPVKKLDNIFIQDRTANISNWTQLKLRSQDILIAGIPKSVSISNPLKGTTWIGEIVWLIENDLDFETAQKIYHFERVFWVDKGVPTRYFDSAPSPRFFKTHLPPKYHPKDFNKIVKAVIYIVRNPKDMLASFFNFARSFKYNQFIGSIDDMVDLFSTGQIEYGPWWEHVNNYSQLDGIYIVHYEDLVERPIETIRELAKYLGKNFTDQQISQLAAFVAFDNMKEMPSFDLRALTFAFNPDLKFFNKGQVGNWKNFLTEEQSKRIDDLVNAKLTYKRPIQYEPSMP